MATVIPEDLKQLRPLVWAFLAGLGLWAAYFITLPTWAGWTLATILGIITSIALGEWLSTRLHRRIQAEEQRKHDEIQAMLDNAQAVNQPDNNQRNRHVRPDPDG